MPPTTETPLQPAAPRWRAIDVILERFGATEVLVAPARGGPAHVVPLDDARVLAACDQFATDAAHTEQLAADLEVEPPDVAAALGRLRALGLVASDDQLRRAAIEAGHRAEPPPAIAALGILTCDRPASVARVLDGLRRSSRLPIWICDDSRTAEGLAGNRQLVEDARGAGADVRLLARPDKQRLADALVAAGAARELVELTLFDPEHTGYTTGANRNAFRLVTAGRLSLLVDDDATIRAARPHGAQPGIRFTTDDHGIAQWFHDSAEAALADGVFEDHDLVAMHEQLLGRTLADCAARHGDAALDLDAASPALIDRLVTGAGRVLVTQAGHAGDAGITSNASFLRLAGEDRQRLAARFAEVRDARALHRATPQLVVTEAPYMMGLTTGIDGRHLLPPWLPFLRNSDGVLAAMMRAVHPDGYLGSLPYLVEHRPPDTRRMAADAMTRGTVELRLSDLVGLVVRGFAALPHGPPDDALDALGRHFLALGALAPGRFAEAVRALRWDEAARQAQHLERSAAIDDEVGRAAQHALDALRAAMLDDRATLISDSADRTQHLLQRFGALCRGWRQILDAAARMDFPRD